MRVLLIGGTAGKYLVPFAKTKLRQMQGEIRKGDLRGKTKWWEVSDGTQIWLHATATGSVAKIFSTSTVFGYSTFLSLSPLSVRVLAFDREGKHFSAFTPSDITPFPATTFVISRDGKSFIGRDPAELFVMSNVHYVYKGTVVGTKALPLMAEQASGMAPDGRSWWMDFFVGSTSLHDLLWGLGGAGGSDRFEIMQLVESESGKSMTTDSFSWVDAIAPRVEDVGLSAWVDPTNNPGGNFATLYEPSPAASARIFAFGQPTSQRNARMVHYGWVSEDVQDGPDPDNRLLTVQSRALFVAVNSRTVTRQADGPEPGEIEVIFDDTISDVFANPNFTQANSPPLYQPAGDAMITPRGNKLIITLRGATDALDSRLYVNGTLVHQDGPRADGGVISLGTVADTQAGLRFLFTETNGDAYLYNAGTLVNLGAANVSSQRFALTADGEFILKYNFSAPSVTLMDLTGAQLALREGVAFYGLLLSPVDYDDPRIIYGAEAGVPKRYAIRTPAENAGTPDAGNYTIAPSGSIPSVPATVEVDGVAYSHFSPPFTVPFSQILNFEEGA